MKQISCWSLIFIMIFIIILHVILKEKIFEGYGGQSEELELEQTDLFSRGASDAGAAMDRDDENGLAAAIAVATNPTVAAALAESDPAAVEPVPTPTPVAAELIDCAGSWGDWSECSETCGGGTKSREYSVNTPAENGGEECPKEDGENENESCNTQGCPVDCVGSWGAWSNCSKKYGDGNKFREYTITKQASNGGDECPHKPHHVETTTCKENNAGKTWLEKFSQNVANVKSIASYNKKRDEADVRAGKNTLPTIFKNGKMIRPLNMTDQGRTTGTWRECRDRCINTPGCKYFNRYPNGDCHITDGKEGPYLDAGNPTSHSGKARAFSPSNTPHTDGRWYMPLNMGGQGRTVESWEGCRDRCIHTDGCEYFNRFGDGGCHITDGKEGHKPGGDNPTSHSGKALKEEVSAGAVTNIASPGGLKEEVSAEAETINISIASPGGSKSLYGVNSANMIYYSPSTDGNWQNIPGGLKQVDTDGTTVCGVNKEDMVYCKDNLTGSNWKKLPGKLKHVSVSDGKLYGVNSANKVYYSPSTDGNWQNIPGGLKQVDIDGTTVCGVNKEDMVYCKDNLTGGNWKNLPGRLKYVSVNG